jgi:hypothetical protein
MAERVAHQPVKPEFITTAIETQRKDDFDYSLKMERMRIMSNKRSAWRSGTRLLLTTPCQ